MKALDQTFGFSRHSRESGKSILILCYLKKKQKGFPRARE